MCSKCAPKQVNPPPQPAASDNCGSGGRAFRPCSWLISVSSIVHPAGMRLTQLNDMKWYLALFTGSGICFFELGERDEKGVSRVSGMRGEEREEGKGEGGFDK